MHLLLAPFLARVILVQTRQIAVVALVQRQVLPYGKTGLTEFGQGQIERVLRASHRPARRAATRNHARRAAVTSAPGTEATPRPQDRPAPVPPPRPPADSPARAPARPPPAAPPSTKAVQGREQAPKRTCGN